jgi:hypothetical protein
VLVLQVKSMLKSVVLIRGMEILLDEDLIFDRLQMASGFGFFALHFFTSATRKRSL